MRLWQKIGEIMAVLDLIRTEVTALKASNDALVAEVTAVAARVAALQSVTPAEVSELAGKIVAETTRVNAAVAALKNVPTVTPPPIP